MIIELDLAEFGLESGVDFVKGAAEREELLTSLIGDQHLRHSIPIDALRRLERHIHHFLTRPAHSRCPMIRRNNLCVCVLGVDETK